MPGALPLDLGAVNWKTGGNMKRSENEKWKKFWLFVYFSDNFSALSLLIHRLIFAIFDDKRRQGVIKAADDLL